MDDSRGVSTGVALANIFGFPVNVTLTLRNSSGAPVPNGTIQVTLAGNGQLARFPTEIYQGRGIDFSSFRGTLEVSSDVAINGMAIRVSPAEFATLPVTPLI